MSCNLPPNNLTATDSFWTVQYIKTQQTRNFAHSRPKTSPLRDRTSGRTTGSKIRGSTLPWHFRMLKHSYKFIFVQRVEGSKYLKTTLTNQNPIHEEINGRLTSGNVWYHFVQNLLCSTLMSKNIKDQKQNSCPLFCMVVKFGHSYWRRNVIWGFREEGAEKNIWA